MEERVKGLKDRKRKYEEDKAKWDEEKKKLTKKVESIEQAMQIVEKLRKSLRELINLGGVVPMPVPVDGKTIVSLDHKELEVNLIHSEKVVNMTTGTVIGRVMYCASTELSKEGFSEAELSEALKEHGWNHPHNTLAPTVGGLVKDGNLVRIEGKPARYRLPAKVKLNIDAGVVQR